MAKVLIIGGSIAGLSSALFLARRGHDVVVLERDGHRLHTELENDFLDWRRPRVPHAVQPHGLLGPVRQVLLEEAPDVYAAMLALGARERHEFDWFAAHPPYRSGDEHLVTVQTRRLLLEVALRRALEREATAAFLPGQQATGLTLEPHTPAPRVTGVRTQGGVIHSDLVLDCAGRRTPIPQWLITAGCRPPVIESHPAGIAYYCRWYRNPPGHNGPPQRTKAGSTTPFAIGGCFPSDNSTFALSFVLSATDPTRVRLRDPLAFEQAAHAFPSMSAWLQPLPQALSPVLAMGGLNNRWSALTDASGPVASRLLQAGDSLIHTNPTLGQGCALALRTAQWIAQHAGRPRRPAELGDEELGMAFHRWARNELRPWYELQVNADLGHAKRLRAGAAGHEPSLTPQSVAEACAFADPLVMRARAQVRHLFRKADTAFNQPGIRERLNRWRAENPHLTGFDGPSRQAWESIIYG